MLKGSLRADMVTFSILILVTILVFVASQKVVAQPLSGLVSAPNQLFNLLILYK